MLRINKYPFMAYSGGMLILIASNAFSQVEREPIAETEISLGLGIGMVPEYLGPRR